MSKEWGSGGSMGTGGPRTGGVGRAGRAGRGLVGGVSLVLLGAAGTYVASHVRIGWGPEAQAQQAQAVAAGAALPPPSASQLQDARQVSRTFAQVAAQVGPAVVRISTAKTEKLRRMQRGGDPFRFFFGPGAPHGFGPHGFGPPDGDDDDDATVPGRKQRGTGSGVVIDPRGYILTNNHVVAEADELKVNFVDGKSVSAQVVGTDPKTDLAVVKVDPAAVADLKVARLGDSDRLQVGEWVIAIGNPFGLDHTVTVGVLSAKNRGIGAATYEDFLQTDASINPGNSGGPLVNLDGEVIGINTAIAGIGTGIGFAVPSTMARPIIDQLIASGKVKRPYLGIAMQDVTAELSKALGSRAPDKGAIVSQIQPGSPADKAGFKAGDVIVSVDGKAVDGSKSVQRAVLGKSIGQKVDVAVWREGKQLVIPTVTAPLPDDGKEAEGPRGGGQKQTTKSKLGLSLQPLSPEIAAELGVPKGTAGVVVGGVRDGGPAQEAGLRRGDVILGVDGQPVRSVDEAQRALVAPRPGGHIVRLQRGDAALFLTLPE